MIFCPGFHNPSASKQTTVCSAAERILVPRKSLLPNFRKGQPLRSHAQCGVQSFISCAEVFHHGAEILKGHRPAAEDHRHTASDQLFSNIYYVKTCVVLFF